MHESVAKQNNDSVHITMGNKSLKQYSYIQNKSIVVEIKENIYTAIGFY